jgi:2-(1,2-epoxy-1,2-dihydrophenyl)acetyl-CoA isomerase
VTARSSQREKTKRLLRIPRLRQMSGQFRNIIYEKKDRIATIILNRPEVLNALSPEMIDELISALNDAKDDKDVRVVIITGAGRAFSAGGDLNAIKNYEKLEVMLKGVNEIVRLLASMEKPVIAAVNGIAVGAGLSLALACDIIIASDQSRFGSAFVRVGLVPDTGATFYLPRCVGLHLAKELAFTGRMIDANEAQRIGLVNRVVPASELQATVDSLAKVLADGPPIAVGLTKKLLNRSPNVSLENALDYETCAQLVCARTEDFKEGVSAALEKRRPKFAGK